jgi:hypothetical protein
LAGRDLQTLVAGLAESHGPQLRRFLLARIRNPADVSDILQDIYLRMLRIPRVESIRSPEAYLFTVAQHVLQQYTLLQSKLRPSIDLEAMIEGLNCRSDADPMLEADAQRCVEDCSKPLICFPPRFARRSFFTAAMGCRSTKSARASESRAHGEEEFGQSVDAIPAQIESGGVRIRMERKFTSTFNDQIYQEACEWFVEFRSQDLDAAGHRRFDAWARQSPEHLAAYLEIAAIWKDGPALGSTLKWDTAALIAHASADAGNIVTLSAQPGTSREVVVPTRAASRPRRSRARAAMVLADGHRARGLNWPHQPP